MTNSFKAPRAACALLLSFASFALACASDDEQTDDDPCAAGTTSCPAAAPDAQTPSQTNSVAPITPVLPGAGEPLSLSLDVLGVDRSCGGCAVLTAKVRGGNQPYTYTWSDPMLSGPGPHQVCPAQSADYSVQVTDTGSESAELARAPQHADANATLPCTTSSAEEPAQGCQVLLAASLADLLFAPEKLQQPPENVGECASVDNPPSTAIPNEKIAYLKFAKPLLAGRTYTYATDLLLPIFIGKPAKLAIWGGTDCHLLEKLGESVADGKDKLRTCFTPTSTIDRIFIWPEDYDPNAVLFSFTAGGSISLCSGCETK